jgi:nitrogen fixation protein NifQ
MLAFLQQIYSEDNRLTAWYRRLTKLTRGLPNDEWLSKILASWRCGRGILPTGIGLDPDVFQYMLIRHFSGIDLSDDGGNHIEIDPARKQELDEINQLLLLHRAGDDISEDWIATIVAAACMGNDHLWQDMGLWSRRELSALMESNFPSLFEKNTGNMKWKRFLYKQLCVQEGIYTCRSPSCEVCADYEECFGPEE